MFHIFVICGESGSGKDTLANRLAKAGFKKIKGTSTRPMRAGESQGNPYNFLDKETFLKEYKENKIIVHNQIYGYHYGIHKDEFAEETIYIVILNPKGIEDITKEFGKENVTGIYLTCPENTRIKRMTDRGDTQENILNKIKADREIFKSAYWCCDYKIDSTNEREDFVEAISIIGEVIEEKEKDKIGR